MVKSSLVTDMHSHCPHYVIKFHCFLIWDFSEKKGGGVLEREPLREEGVVDRVAY